MNPTCDSCDNSDCFINRFVNETWKKKLSKYKVTMEVSKGQQIIYEGNHADQIFFIYRGKVKVFKTVNGHDQIVRLAKKGDILGHRGYGENFLYPISAGALEDATLCIITNPVFFKLLQANSLLCFNLMLFFANELKNSEGRVLYFSKLSGNGRIASALLYVKDTFGYVRGKHRVAVAIDRKDLATLAGVRYETLTRTLSNWSRKRIARHKDEGLEIMNEGALKSFLK